MDTETDTDVAPDGTETHRLVFGWCAYFRRHRGDCWSPGEWSRFTTPDQFLDIVEAHALQGTRLDVWCHNAAFDARVVNAIALMEARGWEVEMACLEGPPTIIQWRKARATVRWLDTLNLWRLPLKAIGDKVNLPKLDFPGMGVVGPEADTYCKRDVEIVWRALREWWDFIQRENLGTCSPTLASQAFTAFRHRFMTHDIYCDTNTAALEIARNSYRGGRVECYKLGHIPGPVSVLDVNSMYPFVMHQVEVPTKLLTVIARRKPEFIADLLHRVAVVAEVELNTALPVYPVDLNKRLCFPIGRFTTTLAGPELQYALDHDHVVKVHRAALYERAPVFRQFVEWCWQQRRDAVARGDTVSAWMFKIIGNSLYGKFGQRGMVWDFTGDVLPGVTADLSSYDLDRGEWVRLRAVGGKVQRLSRESESFNSHPAIASYITSAARLYLWQLMQRAGRDSVIYCDTDSLFIRGEIHPGLKPDIDADRLGALKHEGTHEWCLIHGCKDYELPDRIKRKGVGAHALELSPGVYRDVHWDGWAASLARGDTSSPRTYPVTKQLARHYHKGVPDMYGNVLPLWL